MKKPLLPPRRRISETPKLLSPSLSCLGGTFAFWASRAEEPTPFGSAGGIQSKRLGLLVRPLMWLGGLTAVGLVLVPSWWSLLWAADAPSAKSLPKAPPQITAPGHIDFIKTTGSNRPAKDSPHSQEGSSRRLAAENRGAIGTAKDSPASQEGSSASGSRSSSSEERTGRPYRYYYYYYGPYWPGYPWPYPPPPPPVYIPYGPIFVDPDVAGYGPRSVLRLMGVEHWFSAPPSRQQDTPSRPPAPNRAVNPGAGALDQQPGAPKAPNQPNLNPPLILEGEGKAPPGQAAGAGGQNPAEPAGRNPERAMLLVDLGDAHFAHKKYAEALQRYREAARLDPQLAEAHLHMGFALVALGKYAEAAQAFKQGLELHPNWPASGFRLGVLYGPEEAEPVAHRNALAGAIAAKPNDPDLLFLLGLLFYFDQKLDQARRFFTEAARLAAPNTAHIDPFLRRL